MRDESRGGKSTPGVCSPPIPTPQYRLVAYAEVSAPRARVEVLSHLHQNVLDEFRGRATAE